MPEKLLALRGLSKSFGASHALSKVDLDIYPGEVHALIGENGAGKSTLVKILSGAHAAGGGTMWLQGQVFAPRNPAESRRHGVATIYQELTLAPHLSVEQNITLGLEKTRWGLLRGQQERVRGVLKLLGHEALDPESCVGSLSLGLRQVVEIARALALEAKVVIMDEPTSSLAASDTQALFKVIRKLREQGLAIIYISHFLEEVQAIADRFTVLRDGQAVGTGLIKEATLGRIVQMMAGRTISEMFPKVPHAIGETILEIKNLRGAPLPKGVSLKLRRGEILGLAGLVGSGRSETVRALFGLERAAEGKITLRGAPLKAQGLSPSFALRSGFDLLSENRKDEGLALNCSIKFNLTLSSLQKFSRAAFVNGEKERRATLQWREKLAIKMGDPEKPAGSLSGGNQQKVALARMLEHGSEILFLDEPMRGIDVGSKAEICRLIGALAAQGKAIVLISSYLPELLGICDTLAVMHRGVLSAVRPVLEWTEEEIMRFAASGGTLE